MLIIKCPTIYYKSTTKMFVCACVLRDIFPGIMTLQRTLPKQGNLSVSIYEQWLDYCFKAGWSSYCRQDSDADNDFTRGILLVV